mgnify:FL=1
MANHFEYFDSIVYDINTIDIYVEDMANPGIIASEAKSHIDSLGDDLNPRDITSALLSWSDKILKVDIKDAALNIILSTEVEPDLSDEFHHH